MLTTLLLSILNFLWYDGFEHIWPQSLMGFDLSNITNAANSFFDLLLPGLRLVNVLIAVDTIFASIGVILLILMVFFIIRLFRWIWGLLPFAG